VLSVKQIGGSIEGLFMLEDWHNLSVDYDKTLMAWHENLERSWHSLKPEYSIGVLQDVEVLSSQLCGVISCQKKPSTKNSANSFS